MSEDKKLSVDKDKCIGCGSCVSIAEEYFKLGEDGKSEVIKKYDEKNKDLVSEAIDACPVGAITLK